MAKGGVSMNSKLFRRIVGFVLTAMLLAGSFIMATTPAAAQRVQRRVVIVRPIRPFRPDPFRRFDYYRYRQYVFDDANEAYNEGYQSGLKTGSEDDRKGKSYDPQRSHYFHDAGFGNFAEDYRAGFENGYRAGYGGRIG
jgi:hypothetical protein